MPPEDFAHYLAALGRGPGRSRALTRNEAREAFSQVLAGRTDPHQVGAFLMLLRYRGEDADEIAGLVEAAQAALPTLPSAHLDWPSYGAGRTRGLPLFLLAALALGQSGLRVLMHGSNAFGSAVAVTDGLAALGLRPSRDVEDAAATLNAIGFAYLPIDVLSPEIARLLALRRLLGLRSPVNTVARLLDPARAPAGVCGVFHPAYVDVHLGAAERLGRPRLLVLKGGGGEVERSPTKAGYAFLWDVGQGRSEFLLPATHCADTDRVGALPSRLAKIWLGEVTPAISIGTIHATIALGLLAHSRTTDWNAALDDARYIWSARTP
jgi:anthranilate phosphoribosyltransferase